MKRISIVFALAGSALITLPANAFLNYKSPFRAGRIDWIRSAPEGGQMDPGTKFLSGSVLRKGGKDVNVPVPCKASKCRHLEYVNIPGVPEFIDEAGGLAGMATKSKENPLSVQGNRWEVGPDHFVRGGFGFLAVGPLGIEPTGRLVVQGLDGPAAIKIVLIKVDEKTDTAIFQGFGRYCIRKPHKGWISCTAFVNPLPMFFPVKRGLIMPVDIRISGKMPNPLALGKDALAAKSTFEQKIRQKLISQGFSIASDAIGSGGESGGSGGGSSSGFSGSGCASSSNSYGYKRHAEAQQGDLISVATSPGLSGSERLHKDAAIAFDKMRRDAAKDGIDLNVVSGFRSVSAQKSLWTAQVAKQGSEAKAAKISAPPGSSEHHTGFALDIGSGNSPNLSSDFANSLAYSWLRKNASRYGFKQSYTGQSGQGADNEPWHWRYAGTAAAQQTFNGSSSSGGGVNCGINGSSGGAHSPTYSKSTRRANSPQISAPSAPVLFNGRTMPPLKAPITSGFGNRVHPISHKIKFHDGIDFGASAGTTILAVASGRIMYQGPRGNYGNVVIIDHGGGYSSMYAHVQSFLGNGTPGTLVQMGAPIATVGSTGYSTGPHLHLNIRAGGDGINPNSGYDIDPRSFIRGL